MKSPQIEAETRLRGNMIEQEMIELLKSKSREGIRWAAYRNIEPNSSNYGHYQYLMVGEGCTYPAPPDQYPADTAWGLGWRYRFAKHDMVTRGGKIKKMEGARE